MYSFHKLLILQKRDKTHAVLFIGGLGSNRYHLAPLIENLGFPVTFLDPYREMIQTENDLRDWFQGIAFSEPI